MSEQSLLKFYSFAIVVEDKLVDSDIVTAWPVETIPSVDGLVKDYKVNMKTTGDTASNSTSSATTEAVVTVEATWRDLGGSNQVTAPNVCKNETVLLLKYADDEKLYWTTMGREPKFRRLEHVCYMFSNLKEPGEEYTKKTAYWLEVSTREKHIWLHTANNDGEPFIYDIIIDTKDGQLVFKDDAGNAVLIDSANGTVSHKATKTINLDAPVTNIKGDLKVEGSIGGNRGIQTKGIAYAPDFIKKG